MNSDPITMPDPHDETDACVDGICTIPPRGTSRPQSLSGDVQQRNPSAAYEETIDQMSDVKTTSSLQSEA